MYLAKVIGTVVSTKKEASLTGYKLLVVEKVAADLTGLEEEFVVADYVGAGNGDYVLVGTGSSIRVSEKQARVCVDAAIIGIIDTVDTT